MVRCLHSRIVSFISASGGVGKTKLSLLFAYYLRKRFNVRVLFVDLDPTSGASLLVLKDDVFDRYVNDGRTFSDMIKRYEDGVNVEFYRFKIDVEVGDTFIDFLLPGDDLIDVVDRFWKTGAAGPRFRKMFKSMVPFSRYDYVIIDTAPFFDPRYITLSIYVSRFFVVPLRPSIVDVKRTIRMLNKIRGELEISLEGKGISADSFLRKNVFGVFNLVPSNPRQAECQFVESFLQRRSPSSGGATRIRVERLLRQAQRLADIIRFIRSHVKASATLERFPTEYKQAIDAAKEYLREISNELYRSTTM